MTSKETTIHRNAFHLLGVSVRDTRKRIVELAEEKSLEVDHEACQKARSDLTNPRTRLGVEMAWLPGVSPRKAVQLIDQVMQDPMSMRTETGLPSLAHANLMAAAFESVDATDSPEDIAEFIQELAYLVEDLVVEDVLRDINEDRAVSDFPEVMALDIVESELAERKRYFRNAIKDALNRLPPKSLVDAMTEVVHSVTDGGEYHAPHLIDELVDSYEGEIQGFLQREAENVHKLISAARDFAKTGEAAVKPIIDKLESVVRNWDNVAQPIQLSTKARGIEHQPSHELAFSIRSLAIELFNEYDMLAQSQRITNLLQEIFAELPQLVERVSEDANALDDIVSQQKAQNLLEPIYSICKTALANVEKNPSSAYEEGRYVLNSIAPLLVSLHNKGVPKDLFERGEDEIALVVMNCAVVYGNKTEKWKPCIALLEESSHLAISPETKARIKKNLDIVRRNDKLLGDLLPISSAPSLSTINGIGFTLYGSTDHDPDTGSYLATYYFVFFFVPIFPICRYRVIPSGSGGYQFLGKAPLRTFDKWHIAISVLGILWLFFVNK